MNTDAASYRSPIRSGVKKVNSPPSLRATPSLPRRLSLPLWLIWYANADRISELMKTVRADGRRCPLSRDPLGPKGVVAHPLDSRDLEPRFLDLLNPRDGGIGCKETTK